MSSIKFKNISYCVGGKLYSSTTNIRGDITSNNVNLLRGSCVTCNRYKNLIVSYQTINGEGLGNFFELLGSAAKNVGKKITQ